MTIDRLRRFFDAWNDHDVEAIVSYFTPDGAYYASIGPDDEGTAFRGIERSPSRGGCLSGHIR